MVLVTYLDDYYGPYVLRYCGTIDTLNAITMGPSPWGESLEEVVQWISEYHPKYFWGRYLLTNQEKPEADVHRYMKWDVWVALEEDNVGWKPKEGSKYYEALPPQSRNKSYLPIAKTEKDLRKWVEGSQRVLGLYSNKYES